LSDGEREDGDRLACDGNTAETELRFDVKDATNHQFWREKILSLHLLPDSLFWSKAERIRDKPVLVLLDLSHHSRLSLWCAVVVYNSQSTMQRQGYSHTIFRDRVHRG
jgi:hypothetical protein